MAEFTPPAVPHGMDLTTHIFATRNVIRSWHPNDVEFHGITLWREARFILATDPRIQRGAGLRQRELNTMWGMPLKFSETKDDRTYTIAFTPR